MTTPGPCRNLLNGASVSRTGRRVSRAGGPPGKIVKKPKSDPEASYEFREEPEELEELARHLYRGDLPREEGARRLLQDFLRHTEAVRQLYCHFFRTTE